MKHRNTLRRLLLGSLALAAVAAPPVGAGCAANFAPISQVQGLRVVAVVPESNSSYVAPQNPNQPGCNDSDAGQCVLAEGASVTFDMSYEYTYANQVVLNGQPAQIAGNPVQIVWLGGCVNPAGDEYYGCYAQFAPLLAELGPYFQSHNPADIPAAALAFLHLGPSFEMSLPSDLIASRPTTPGLPAYGIAFAFFLACAGQLGPAAGGSDLGGGGGGGGGLAGTFPIGCFGNDGTACRSDGDCGGGGCVGGVCRCASDGDCGGSGCFAGVCYPPLGAEYFVPGYTQVYAFADGYLNNNPPVHGLTITVSGSADDGGADDGGADGGSADYCGVSEAARNASGCAQASTSGCVTYDVTVDVRDDVADYDPANGVYETVWVDYFADQGDIDTPVLLIAASAPGQAPGPDGGYPPSPGLQMGHFTAHWTPPPPPPGADAGVDAGDGGAPSETATLWAVVHDSRGGSTVMLRQVTLSAASPDGG